MLVAVAIKHRLLAFPIGNLYNIKYTLYNVINKVEQDSALFRFRVGYTDTHIHIHMSFNDYNLQYI